MALPDSEWTGTVRWALAGRKDFTTLVMVPSALPCEGARSKSLGALGAPQPETIKVKKRRALKPDLFISYNLLWFICG
ncbi:hypothetical protein D3C75_620820 [compost metagenome]